MLASCTDPTRDSLCWQRKVKAESVPWDMAVVGAGPAGSVCACSALATSPHLRVALIDRESFPRDKPCGDAIRSDAISALRELGLGAIFDGRPLISELHSTAQDARFAYLEELVKLMSKNNEFAFCVVPRSLFDHHLFKGAQMRGARDFTGYRLADAEYDEAACLWTLELQDERGVAVKIRCRVLVGADGAGSRVRRLAGLRRNGEAHTMLALRAYATAYNLPRGALRFDWLASVIPGYGWVFPLVDRKVNVGIGVRSLEFKRSGIGLQSCLEEYVRYLLGMGVSIRDLDDIKVKPLPLASHAPPLVPRRQMALVGDAASMIDPLMGEGIHYGIWAGHRLGRAIGDSLGQGGDLEAGLESYAKEYAEQFGEVMQWFESVRNQILFHKYFG